MQSRCTVNYHNITDPVLRAEDKLRCSLMTRCRNEVANVRPESCENAIIDCSIRLRSHSSCSAHQEIVERKCEAFGGYEGSYCRELADCSATGGLSLDPRRSALDCFDLSIDCVTVRRHGCGHVLRRIVDEVCHGEAMRVMDYMDSATHHFNFDKPYNVAWIRLACSKLDQCHNDTVVAAASTVASCSQAVQDCGRTLAEEASCPEKWEAMKAECWHRSGEDKTACAEYEACRIDPTVVSVDASDDEACLDAFVACAAKKLKEAEQSG